MAETVSDLRVGLYTCLSMTSELAILGTLNRKAKIFLKFFKAIMKTLKQIPLRHIYWDQKKRCKTKKSLRITSAESRSRYFSKIDKTSYLQQVILESGETISTWSGGVITKNLTLVERVKDKLFCKNFTKN